MKSNRCDGAAGEQTGNNPDAPPGTVNFTLMTKKGNKQQFKSIPVPADSELVQRIRTRDEVGLVTFIKLTTICKYQCIN